MSTKLTGYVWDACASSGMKLSSVAIMARLADFSSDEGVSWPSIATIARQIGAGESTVRTAIGQLEKDGWLTRQQRRKGNRNASNVYQLNVTKLRESAFSHLSESDASKSDASKSDPSKFDASKNINNGGFHPSESGGDPSVKSTTEPSDKKPSCQVAQQPDDECDRKKYDPEVLLTENSKSVLKHLNLVSGSRFQNCSASLDNIRARLREGFTAEELMLVIDYKNEHWKGLKDYQYMRPKTLFIPGNFPGYLQVATRWDAKGRPKREDWDAARKKNSLTFGGPDKAIPAGFRGAKP
ncbi:TPA: conserved phage C-terminal domain-containing protein [Enterobacter kobei]|uniref:conserved phage C-terminal domain-containing protein n=1 Tax=Enterobacter kobei TaxID=208224 RepID=UPI000642EA9E|nr:conserved phage C-terminal domain-containing protein [Enterobacter kobei]ELE9699155.1 conserved phage C-terminal domain-containing protein [Enterobacter kobei]ELE9753944.1 conserved phage C-terminal domain-containing protein [Enterobacter kobei]ELF1031686.1 conserved phage C-terminal domain-containing protein [Enterobacter kobei]ELI0575501.1 conserved phage C-terminal domain-containing protein [Enterobacter kobei]ELI8912941.1 conserved phage C-terminal domain-containing protein [Enterobacte